MSTVSDSPFLTSRELEEVLTQSGHPRIYKHTWKWGTRRSNIFSAGGVPKRALPPDHGKCGAGDDAHDLNPTCASSMIDALPTSARPPG